ncbi:prepilin-type N-terminal cleavage/methylation domain-containing protein [Paenibacillus sp. FSL R7-0331]|uniref:prepilin-type N-terminal cleavage/methylation domain-containing protein n=1 Tax=Paenibacillus sp. FSL R7-0331 TaxID=1536773 RepID=UPI0006948847|nr:prepilin-type N-terminal cleavage/methylation domain-containing protein [Paenibacillus sp. FSL R7-0331]
MLAQAIRKKLGKAGKEEKGFTLIELLAVIVILGIIAVIAVPMITRLITNTGTKADLATARQVYEASRLYVTTELNGNAGTTTITIEGTNGLIALGYLEAGILLPSNKQTITSGTVYYSGGVLSNTTVSGATGPAVTLVTTGQTRSYSRDQVVTTEVSPNP